MKSVIVSLLVLTATFPTAHAGTKAKPPQTMSASSGCAPDIICVPITDDRPDPWGGDYGGPGTPGSPGYPPVGGGGGAGAGSAGTGNDGTRGTAMNNNRFYPGCMDEKLFMEQTLTQVLNTGKPVGTVVPLTIGDPEYQSNEYNGTWTKYQAIMYGHRYRVATGTMKYITINIHYMHNDKFGLVEQMKLKNSYENGCVGF